MSAPKKPEQSALGKAYRAFDRGLVACVDTIKTNLIEALDKIDDRIDKVEDAVITYVQGIKATTTKDLDFASGVVTREMRNKVLISQWVASFLAGSRDVSLDPIAYSFARFAFTICACYDAVSGDYFVSTNIHVLMLSLMKFDSELISGPATMALMHLSLHNEMRPELIRIQLLPSLLKVLVNSNSQIILTQAAKLCASLALHDECKSELAGSGCFHILLDLTGGMHKIANKNTQRAAASAAVNIIHNNNANRLLAVELTGIKAFLNAIRMSSNEYIIMQGLRGLCNIAFFNKFTGTQILAAGGDSVIVDILESGDILRQPDTAVVALACLTNICTTEAAQSHVGSSGGAVTSAIRICEYGREPRTVAAAARFLCATVYRNTGNKARCAASGAIKVLMKKIIKHSQYKDDENLHCFEVLCYALASILLYPTNHELMKDIKALPEVVNLCKKSGQKRVVAAASMVITALVPSPDDLYRFHQDEIPVECEECDVGAVLRKARVFAFGDDVGAPQWCELALSYLTMTDNELKMQQAWTKEEFKDREIYFREYNTSIRADSEVAKFNGAKGLIFSIY
jgi:hypothetical protein